MPVTLMRQLTPVALGFAAAALALTGPAWLLRLEQQGAQPPGLWLELLFPVLMGLMFGLTLKPKYAAGYTVFVLGLTGGLLLYTQLLGMKNDGFPVMYAVLLMAWVQTAVMAWRGRR